MSHFAKVENGMVTQVIVAEQDVIDTGLFVDGWIQSSDNEEKPVRKNQAGIGYAYDINLDAFIPPKPYASWTLNLETCLWNAPVAYPNDEKKYMWDESVLNWVEITQP